MSHRLTYGIVAHHLRGDGIAACKESFVVLIDVKDRARLTQVVTAAATARTAHPSWVVRPAHETK
jgi:hypothetical protein